MGLLGYSGEGGIRTLERACAPYSLSRRVPSATRPPLRGLATDSSPAFASRAAAHSIRSRRGECDRHQPPNRGPDGRPRGAPRSLRGDLRLRHRALRLRRSRRARRQRALHARPGGRQADPHRLEVGALGGGAASHPRARPRLRGHPLLHPARGALPRPAGLRGHRRRVPDRRPRGARRAGRAGSRGAGQRAGADGRQLASPRPDRVGDPGRRGRAPRLPGPGRRLVAAGRKAGADRPQALTGQNPGAGPPDGGRDRGASRHAPGGGDGLRGAHRRRRRPDPGPSLAQRLDPPHAGRLGARHPPPPAADGRRGPRAGVARVRERRRDREPRPNGRGAASSPSSPPAPASTTRCCSTTIAPSP